MDQKEQKTTLGRFYGIHSIVLHCTQLFWLSIIVMKHPRYLKWVLLCTLLRQSTGGFEIPERWGCHYKVDSVFVCDLVL